MKKILVVMRETFPTNEILTKENLKNKRILNPYDEYALFQGKKIKEAEGGEIICLLFSERESQYGLRTALGLGADRGIFVYYPGKSEKIIGKILAEEIKKEEYVLLNDFLYEAIYIPDGVEPPPKSIINCPELQEYVFEFGKRKDDRALVAEVQGNVVGAIWVRIMNDYGHIDNDTPSLAMSVFQKYRGQGIGTSLLQQLLSMEKSFGYSKISLSVQKNNYAVKMYKKAGFLVVDENSEEYIMTATL